MKQIKLLSWNTRGLGCPDKCNGVRSMIRFARCDVVCIQESKLNEFNLAYFSSFLPSYLEKSCVYINAVNHNGGCIISWRKSYTSLNSWSTRHTCSVVLRQNSSGSVFTVTNVYGPSVDAQKQDFLRELEELAKTIQQPWCLVGDFNMVRWMIDRSGDYRCLSLMDNFNDLIMRLQLVDIPLKNRDYTWCNKQPDPIFSKIDRCFLTSDWTTSYPIITLHAQESMISDHIPLLLTCKHRRQVKKQQQMELNWLRNPEMKKVVLALWAQSNRASLVHAAGAFMYKTEQLKNIMGKWHKDHLGKMDIQLNY